MKLWKLWTFEFFFLPWKKHSTCHRYYSQRSWKRGDFPRRDCPGTPRVPSWIRIRWPRDQSPVASVPKRHKPKSVNLAKGAKARPGRPMVGFFGMFEGRDVVGPEIVPFLGVLRWRVFWGESAEVGQLVHGFFGILWAFLGFWDPVFLFLEISKNKLVHKECKIIDLFARLQRSIAKVTPWKTSLITAPAIKCVTANLPVPSKVYIQVYCKSYAFMFEYISLEMHSDFSYNSSGHKCMVSIRSHVAEETCSQTKHLRKYSPRYTCLLHPNLPTCNVSDLVIDHNFYIARK